MGDISCITGELPGHDECHPRNFLGVMSSAREVPGCNEYLPECRQLNFKDHHFQRVGYK